MRINSFKIFTLLLTLMFSINSNSQTVAANNLFENEINMVICYGQSLSVRSGGISGKSNLRNMLAFPGGCNEYKAKVNGKNPQDPKTVKFYGTDFIEVGKKAGATPVKETPQPEKKAPKGKKKKGKKGKSKKGGPAMNSMPGGAPSTGAAAVAWMNMLEEENGIKMEDTKYQFVLSTPGYSGESIENLSKGAAKGYYDRLILSVTKAKEFSDKRGKSFGVPVVFWVQGEANIHAETSLQDYYDMLQKLAEDLNKDIKSITGQKEDVVFIPYQTAPQRGTRTFKRGGPHEFKSSWPSFAQVKLANEHPNVYFGGAMYQYTYGDPWHPKDAAIVGHQLGLQAKRVIHDKKPIRIFQPIANKVKKGKKGYEVHVTFDVPVAPMRFDTSGGAYHNPKGKQKNFGFELTNEAGEDIIAAEPTIVNGNTLVIVCKEKPTHAKLGYALSGNNGGGNLCDSQNILIKNKGTEYPLDNFCVAFRDYVIK